MWAQVTAVYAWLVPPGGRYKGTCGRLLLCWSGRHLEEVTLQSWLSIAPGLRPVEVIMMETEAATTVLGLPQLKLLSKPTLATAYARLGATRAMQVETGCWLHLDPLSKLDGHAVASPRLSGVWRPLRDFRKIRGWS